MLPTMVGFLSRVMTFGIFEEEMATRYVANISLSRKIDVQEISDMVIHLYSEAGRSLLGMSIGVCGNAETMRRSLISELEIM